MSYGEFLLNKKFRQIDSGFDASCMDMPLQMKDFQSDIVLWACRKGKAAIFADTGLGKTLMQITWADIVSKHTGRPVLIFAPLCVAHQTVREGEKFGINLSFVRHGDAIESAGVYITNYEMAKNFSPGDLSGVVLDESSILKGIDGSTRKHLTEFAKKIDYRLSCTATPSPNDFMEIGTQAEFLGVMSQTEMLATYFIHDGSDTSKWRLKGHGQRKFWQWMSEWSVFIRNPADLGYLGETYVLPKLCLVEHVIETEPDGSLFSDIATGLLERNRARRDSIAMRSEKAAELMNGWDSCIAWCNLNSESEAIRDISGAVEITGSMTDHAKETAILGFTNGEIPKIVTKPKIAGFGLNWQHCNRMVFVGLSDSFESFYQSVRRCWRYGQKREVEAHIVISDREGAVLDNIRRKQKQFDEMASELSAIMRDLTISEIKCSTKNIKDEYSANNKINLPRFL